MHALVFCFFVTTLVLSATTFILKKKVRMVLEIPMNKKDNVVDVSCVIKGDNSNRVLMA